MPYIPLIYGILTFLPSLYSLKTAKNLVLAGVGHLMLIDDVTVSRFGQSSFLVNNNAEKDAPMSSACVETLKDMNPLVKVESQNKSPSDFLDETGVEGFNMVISCNLNSKIFARADTLCTAANIPFCCSQSKGICGWIFINLQNHEFIVEVCF